MEDESELLKVNIEITEAKSILYEMNDGGNEFNFKSNIDSAMSQAYHELEILDETINSIRLLKPECDKVDYILAVGSGTLCGIIDIFLVGKPGESPLGDISDKWFEDRTKDFAKISGWNFEKNNSASSAIAFLEKNYKVPYDQRGAGDAGSFVFDLNPTNHHFKSLAHNPSLLGLFFSILDQFTNSSHFVTDGKLISLVKADEKFKLQGSNIPSKLFCAFANWFTHLISDMSGASGSKGRGMGIPSPLWTWANDVIAIKRKLNIPVSEFDKSANELALKIFNKGFDARFQTTQAIPVFINEMVVRMVYSIRRLIKYFSETDKGNRSLVGLWQNCEPFSNPTVKRMLTVAHGTFCLIDLGDATVRGFASGAGMFDPTQFFLRVNIVGVGRFTISLYGEVGREIKYKRAEKDSAFATSEMMIVKNYIEGLRILSETYDDINLINFVEDLKSSDAYATAFEKSIILAEKRHVPKEEILKNKEDIDKYFGGISDGQKRN